MQLTMAWSIILALSALVVLLLTDSALARTAPLQTA